SIVNAQNPLFWSTAAAQISISTFGVTPGVVVGTSVVNLALGVTYYFQINSEDEVSRWSGWSNTAQCVLADIYPPVPVTNLTAQATANEGVVQLSWTAPDSDLGAQAGYPSASYLLR